MASIYVRKTVQHTWHVSYETWDGMQDAGTFDSKEPAIRAAEHISDVLDGYTIIVVTPPDPAI